MKKFAKFTAEARKALVALGGAAAASVPLVVDGDVSTADKVAIALFFATAVGVFLAPNKPAT